MAKLFNLAGMSTATTGTGTITLGSALYGHLTFAQAGVADGEPVTYAIKDGANSEIGRGVYTSSGTTLTRTVLKSTNSDAAINLSGSAEVIITAAAEDFAGQSDGDATAPAFTWAADTNTGFFRPGADALGIATGGTERARFTGGNFALANTSAPFLFTLGAPSSALQTIAGTATPIGMAANNAGMFCAESTATSSGGAGALFQLYCNDGAAMASGDRLGGFLIGGSSSASALRVAGSVEAFTTQAWTDGSAYGSKVNFRAVPDGGTSRADKLIINGSGPVTPGADNTQTLGSASLRWSEIFAGNGTINTSDGTQKTVRGPLSAAELAAWGRLTWKVYQWSSSVAEKGENARLHAGLIAQDVLAAFAAEGLDARRYGLFCEDDEFETVETGTTLDGAVMTEQRPTGKKRMGLRYDQCQAFESAFVRSKIAGGVFEFAGRQFGKSADEQSRAGMLIAAAQIAVIDGAQPGDLRWLNASKDFAIEDASGEQVPMDASTAVSYCSAMLKSLVA